MSRLVVPLITVVVAIVVLTGWDDDVMRVRPECVHQPDDVGEWQQRRAEPDQVAGA